MSRLMKIAADTAASNLPGVIVGAENRERVRDFFATHLGCTNIECARALGLSAYAVGRHVEKLRAEWQDSQP